MLKPGVQKRLMWASGFLISLTLIFNMFSGPTVMKAHKICGGKTVTSHPSVKDKMVDGKIMLIGDLNIAPFDSKSICFLRSYFP